jgi:DNA polymerase V
MNSVNLFTSNDAVTKATGSSVFKPGNKPGFDFDGNEIGIDLNEALIYNRKETYFMRVNTEVMNGAGIFKGDVLIVDRSMKATEGKVIIALLNGDLLIRRFEKKNNMISLFTDANKLSPLCINVNSQDYSIWGVVTYVIHKP